MSIKIGRVLGIDIKMHWSFLALVGFFIVFNTTIDIRMGILTALFILALFGSVIIHEFFHAIAAKYYKYPTKEILLTPLGGAAKIEDLPSDPKQELIIAAVGPLANFILLAISGTVWFFLRNSSITLLDIPLQSYLWEFSRINIILGLFNLLFPALPLDGGRILRSLLAFRFSHPMATQYAVNASKVIAGTIIAGSILLVVLGIIEWVTIIILVLICVFIFIVSPSELQYSISNYLHKTTIEQTLDRIGIVNTPSLSTNTQLNTIEDWTLSGKGKENYIIRSDVSQEVQGVLLSEDIRKLGHLDFQNRVAGEIMHRDAPIVPQVIPLIEGIRIMQRYQIPALIASNVFSRGLEGEYVASPQIRIFTISHLKKELPLKKLFPDYKT